MKSRVFKGIITVTLCVSMVLTSIQYTDASIADTGFITNTNKNEGTTGDETPDIVKDEGSTKGTPAEVTVTTTPAATPAPEITATPAVTSDPEVTTTPAPTTEGTTQMPETTVTPIPTPAIEIPENKVPLSSGVSDNTISDNSIEKEVSILAETNGIGITVSGSSKVIPEGSILQVTELEPQSVEMGIVDEALETEEKENKVKIQKYRAFDIKIMNGEVEVQPGENVKITFSGDLLVPEGEEEVDVYHVDDENVTVTSVLEEKSNDEVTAISDSFSTYVLVIKNAITKYIVTSKCFLTEKGGISKQIYKPTETEVPVSDGDDIYTVSCSDIKDGDKVVYQLYKVIIKDLDGKEIKTLSGNVAPYQYENDNSEDFTVEMYYSECANEFSNGVTFFDYDVWGIAGSKDAGINSTGKKIKDGTYLSIGQTGTEYSYSLPMEKTVMAGGSQQKRSLDANFNNVENGDYFEEGYDAIVPGIVSKLSGDNYEALEMGNNKNDKKIVEPGLFSKEPVDGKTIYSEDFKLNFQQIGNRYIMLNAENVNSRTKTEAVKLNADYSVNGTPSRKFFPLNEVSSKSHPDGSDKNNWYFGMRYDFDFTIGDYVGPLSYTFEGDDDLWVFMDGQLLLDLGGMHSTYPGTYYETPEENTVDLWQHIVGGSVDTSDENWWENLTEEQKAKYEVEIKKTHQITVLYMERGGYDSSCYMDFVIPNLSERTPVISTTPKIDVAFNKVSAIRPYPVLQGADFSLTNNDTDKVFTASSDVDGLVKFSGMKAGTYTLVEVDAPDNFEMSTVKWQVVVGGTTENNMYYTIQKMNEKEQPVGTVLYDSRTAGSAELYKIMNSPKAEITWNVDVDKSAKLIDWDQRIYEVNLYAQAEKKSTSTMVEIEPADIVLVLDVSGSMAFSMEGNEDHSNERLKALKAAANTFIASTSELSPESRIAIIPFSNSVKTVTDFTDMNANGISNLKTKIKNLSADGGTRQDKALNKANELVNGRSSKENDAIVILFSDGVPDEHLENYRQYEYNQKVEAAANTVKQNDSIKTLYSVFLGKDTGKMPTSKDKYDVEKHPSHHYGSSNVTYQSWFMSTIPSEGCGHTADSAESLKDIFEEISSTMTEQLPVTGTIVDVIDPRFHLTDEAGNIISVEEIKSKGSIQAYDGVVSVKSIEIEGTMVETLQIKWENVEIPVGGWNKSIQVMAKETYLGGNDVRTNGAGSEVVFHVEEGKTETKEFPKPTVNVKVQFEMKDAEDVFFLGEKVSDVYDDNKLLEKFDVLDTNGVYTLQHKGTDGTIHTYSDMKDVSITSAIDDKLLQMEPEEETKYDRAVTISVTPNRDGKESAENMVYQGTRTDGYDDNGNLLVKNGDTWYYAVVSPIEVSGAFTAFVVDGTIDIKKTIDEYYEKQKVSEKIKDNQTFIFKVERYDKVDEGTYKQDMDFGAVYETISFSQSDEKDKTRTLIGLKKGYYKITEEESWSWKYEKKESNISGKSESDYVLIGERSTVDYNGAATQVSFSGLDVAPRTYMKAGRYDRLSEETKKMINQESEVNAVITFINDKKKKKWLGDVSAITNIFD